LLYKSTRDRIFPLFIQATFFCPEVPAGVAAGDGGSAEKFVQVTYRAEPLPPGAIEWVHARLCELTSSFSGVTGIPVRDVDSAVRRAVVTLEELGRDALCYAVRASIVPQLESAAEQLALLLRRSGEVAPGTRAGLESLRGILAAAADALALDEHLLTLASPVSHKAKTLLELLIELFRVHSTDPGYRGVVFVEQIALTAPLAHLLTEGLVAAHLTSAGTREVRVRAVSGVGSMSGPKREREMADFHAGRTQVLVCTAALEEGVDVADCAFVVRYSKFATTKSHVQGAGRARRPDAKIFYFLNDAEGSEFLSRCNAQYSAILLCACSNLQRRRKGRGE
jgi:hypothetical protein